MSGAFRQVRLGSFKQSWPIFALVIIIFALGITTGTLSINAMDSSKTGDLVGNLDAFWEQANQLSIDSARAVRSAIQDNLITIAALYILSLTVIGIPFALGLVFVKGFTLGFAVGFLAKEKALEGLLLALVAILPQNLFYLPALLLGVVASLSFAMLLLRRYFNTEVKVWPGFIGYTSVMVVVLVLTMGSAIVEAYITPWLTRTAAGLLTNGFSGLAGLF